MNLTSAGVMSASLIIGVGAAVTIFDAATSSGSEPEAVRSPVVLKEDRRGPNRGPERFAPCEKPAKLIDGVCLTDVTRTVVVPPESAPLRQPEPGRTRVEGPDEIEEVVEPDDDYDDYDDTGTHTRTRSRSHDTGTGTGTQTRTRTGH